VADSLAVRVGLPVDRVDRAASVPGQADQVDLPVVLVARAPSAVVQVALPVAQADPAEVQVGRAGLPEGPVGPVGP
jgi:hypothetical protein